MMALNEKRDFILCEIKSSLFHASDHRNGYITTFRSICDSYQLFGIKVNITTHTMWGSHGVHGIHEAAKLSQCKHDSNGRQFWHYRTLAPLVVWIIICLKSVSGRLVYVLYVGRYAVTRLRSYAFYTQPPVVIVVLGEILGMGSVHYCVYYIVNRNSPLCGVFAIYPPALAPGGHSWTIYRSCIVKLGIVLYL